MLSWRQERKRDKRKREKNEQKNNKNRSVILWDNIAASGDLGLDGGSDYVSIDSAYDRLYANVDNDGDFASAVYSDHSDDLDNQDNQTVPDIDVSYVSGHNKNKDSEQDAMSKYKALEEQRKKEFDDFNKMDIFQ